MRAKVTQAFSGAPDGDPRTRLIREDEIIEGELAAVAVREGWAEELPEPGSEPAVVKPEGDALIAAVVAAIPQLDKDEDYTRRDVPSTAALARVLGYAVSGAERDAAWEKAQDGNSKGELGV